MTSAKPYLIKAFYDWILDNHCTPYLLVDAKFEGVVVPEDYIEDGRIVLNISPTAVRDLEISKSAVNFSARFSGVSRDIYVPMKAAMAIYASENGRGMVLTDSEGDDDEPPPSDDHSDSDVTKDESKSPKGKPKLRVVK